MELDARGEAAATYEVVGEGLRLTIPPEQPLWCPDLHDEPLRVSAIQSGNWSGPLGSTRGQQPFRDGLVVREPQDARWGFTPHYGHVEAECRALLTERSMFSAWMVGLEVELDDCGEICLVEVFGDTLAGGPVAAVGHGIKRIRDPRLRQDFVAQPRPIDITEAHVYAVDWRQGEVDFLLDGERLRTVSGTPVPDAAHHRGLRLSGPRSARRRRRSDSGAHRASRERRIHVRPR